MRSRLVATLAAAGLALAPISGAAAQSSASSLSLSQAAPAEMRTGAGIENPNALEGDGWIIAGVAAVAVIIFFIVILGDDDDDDSTSP